MKLHRKIKHNEKVCRTHDLGSYAQGQGRNQVKGQNLVSAITQKLLYVSLCSYLVVMAITIDFLGDVVGVWRGDGNWPFCKSNADIMTNLLQKSFFDI